MNLTLGELIVWVIVGALAGTLVGRLVTFKKEGLGRWTNLGVGIVGALIGGVIFNLFRIDLGLGALKVTFEDLVSAVLGAFLFVGGWWAIKKYAIKKRVE